MKNRDKFKTPEEREKAHRQWCMDFNEYEKICLCIQDCDYCFEFWLELEAEEAHDEE